jgi:eukaryotic-like serine/threonine-protein kinase
MMAGEKRRDLQSMVDELLADAMELPSAERRQFLLDRASDPDLLAETLALIGFADVLDAEDAARGLWGRDSGDRIGPYSLQRMLGNGAFGEVYLAVREDVGQRVAIKLLRPSVDAQDQARFENEARLLASLDHPNITRLIDYGRSAAGRLYLVMELADGGTLDGWIKRHRPSRQDTVRLFVKICDAVQYAHSNLIIHRDIKPSNILLDTRGEPKLADFGIVQMLGTLAASSSGPQSPAGTPAYASPEQFEHAPLTTASDVYSLGAVLYESIHGRRPPRRKPGQAAPAPARGKPDDLDAILIRSLDPNPRARYANAGELRDDLQAYIERRPARAGRRDWIHVGRLFAQRNRAAVAAGATGLILLLAAFGWIWQQNVELRAATAEKTERIRQVMEAAEHVDQLQRAEYNQVWKGNADARAALAAAERRMRVDPTLDTRFNAAVCLRALAEVLLHADGRRERLEGWNELNRASDLLKSIRAEDPAYIGVQKELALIDGIRSELNSGVWTGGLGFAAERTPPRLDPGPQAGEAAVDARSARGLGNLWLSLGQPYKAAAAYRRAVQLFDRAIAEGGAGLDRERNECIQRMRSIQ